MCNSSPTSLSIFGIRKRIAVQAWHPDVCSTYHTARGTGLQTLQQSHTEPAGIISTTSELKSVWNPASSGYARAQSIDTAVLNTQNLRNQTAPCI